MSTTQAPWDIGKQDGQEAKAALKFAAVRLNLFRLLTLYLKPILPNLAEQVEDFPEH